MSWLGPPRPPKSYSLEEREAFKQIVQAGQGIDNLLGGKEFRTAYARYKARRKAHMLFARNQRHWKEQLGHK